eukprot:6041750-Alexandrium_andersonii.AAC.1
MAPKKKSKAERVPVVQLVTILELFLVTTQQATINLGKYAKFGCGSSINTDVILRWAEPISEILKVCSSGVLNWDSLDKFLPALRTSSCMRPQQRQG